MVRGVAQRSEFCLTDTIGEEEEDRYHRENCLLASQQKFQKWKGLVCWEHGAEPREAVNRAQVRRFPTRKQKQQALSENAGCRLKKLGDRAAANPGMQPR